MPEFDLYPNDPFGGWTSVQFRARIEKLEKEAQFLRGADARASIYLSIAADRLDAGAAYEGGHFDCDYEHPIHERITDICRENARLYAENAGLKADKAEWLKANGPGGWIDQLRAENAGLREENIRLRGEIIEYPRGYGPGDAARGAK